MVRASRLDADNVVSMLKAGASVAAIAKRYGVTPSNVYHILKGIGINLKPGRSKKALPIPIEMLYEMFATGDYSLVELAANANVTPRTLQRRLKEFEDGYGSIPDKAPARDA